jgi:hypothetical protein
MRNATSAIPSMTTKHRERLPMHGSLHLILATETDRNRRAGADHARLVSSLRRPLAAAREIAGARLLRLENAGHGVDRPDWAAISGILKHTASADRASGR